MKYNWWQTVLIALIPAAVGVVVGYFLKYYLDKKQEFVTKNAEIKRGAYLELCALMLDLFSQDKVGQMSPKTMMIRLNSFYSKYILYASPTVVVSFGEFMQYIYKNSEALDTKRVMKKMTHVFKEMRSDISLSNDLLGDDSEKLLRARFTDYDEVIEGKTPSAIVSLTDEEADSVAQIQPEGDSAKNIHVTRPKSKKRKKRK